METLQKKLEKVLKKELADGHTDLETLPNDHVCGDVVSSDFEGETYEERRQRIRKILRDRLDQKELVSVSTLLAYTPQEWAYEPKES